MKFWAQVLHFTVECGISKIKYQNDNAKFKISLRHRRIQKQTKIFTF
jgi:hypothetical protein